MLAAALLDSATANLQRAGIVSAEVEAELLLAFLLNINRSELQKLIALSTPISDQQAASYQQLISRRSARVPLQHITGTAYFRQLELKVGPGVFIPRPETESLVQLLLENLAEGNRRVFDIGSGSGAIAIAVATERADTQVYAIEKSPKAYEYLLENFRNYQLPIQRALNIDLSDVPAEFFGTIDAVISNPPYIPTDAVPLDPEVRLHDPQLALYGGFDGFAVIREISTLAKQLLLPSGLLILEHAENQAASLGELLLADGWVEISSHRDLAGKDRMVMARKANRGGD